MTKNRIQHALGKLNGYFDGPLIFFFQIVFTFYTLKLKKKFVKSQESNFRKVSEAFKNPCFKSHIQPEVQLYSLINIQQGAKQTGQ